MSFEKEKVLKSAEKHIQHGNVDAAIADYRKIVDADPQDFLAINTLGDLYVRAGQPAEAIKDFFQVAETYRNSNQTVRAIAMYKKIHKIDPNNLETCLRLAELYAKQKLIVDARQMYLIAIDAYKKNGRGREALNLLNSLAELEPQNTTLRLELARSYQQEKMNEEACESYIIAGKEFVRARHFADGVEALQQALTINPESKPALEALVGALTEQGGLERALTIISNSIGKHPQDKELVLLLGRTYLNADMIEQAEQTFNYLFELDKSHCEYMLEVAHHYLNGWNVERAIACMDRVLEQLLAQNQVRAATAFLKEILVAEPTNILALRRMVYIYMHTHENRNLIATLKLFIQAALIQGLRSEAIWALSQLVELEPEEQENQGQLEILRGSENNQVASENDVAIDPLLQTFHPLTQDPKKSGGEEKVVAAAVSKPQSQGTAMLLEGMVNQRPEMLDAQVALLEELVKDYPDYIEARLKLRQVYHERGMRKEEVEQCQHLARLFEVQGDKARAKEFMSLAYEIHLLVDNAPAPALSFQLGRTGPSETASATPVSPLAGKTQPPSSQRQTESGAGITVGSDDIIKCLLDSTYLDRVWRHAARNSRPFSLILLHLDGFAGYQEKYGQSQAKAALDRVTDTIAEELKRPIDELLTSRDDGFALVLPETAEEGAAIVAERVRTAIAALAIPYPASADAVLTANLGVTTQIPPRNSNTDGIIAAAEQARQQAINKGGNCVMAG